MAAIAKQAKVTSERMINMVKRPGHNDQITAPAAEAINAGAPIRLDTASGRWTNGNTSSAAENPTHIAMRTVAAGQNVTGVRNCTVDFLVLDALNFGAVVHAFNTDDTYDTTAGTAAVIVGRVVPGFSQLLGNPPDKLLEIGSMGA